MTEFGNETSDVLRFRRRLWSIAAIVLLGFMLLTWRAYFLQVVRHDDYVQRAESNRTAVVPIVPNRGRIVDRNGVILATNYAAYTLEITPSKVSNLEQTLDELSQIIDIQPIHRRRFERLRGELGRYDSVPIRSQLTQEEVARFSSQAYRFPGVELQARLFRTYPMGNTASHAIGYIGRINQREKEQLEDSDEEANYRGTSYIGKQGIEGTYERELHGITGVEQLERSSGGKPIRTLDSSPARSGNTISLTLDIKLQRMVEELFGNRRGALVAIDPNNGEVLAMVSMPTFNPNLFVEGIDQENWQALNESIDRPLFNRALRGLYPPGSTYKPFMSLAALELGVRSANKIIQDNGTWTLGNHNYRSIHPSGPVDMRKAITQSSNVYFYSLAFEMGVDAIHDFMKPLGFGQLTGIDVNGEARGILPSREWKRKAFKDVRNQSWIPGDTVSLGIGQGYNSFTILQLAHALSVLANGGKNYLPHLAKNRVDSVTHEVQAFPQPEPVDFGFKPENIKVVHEGMIGVVNNGTRRIFGNAPYTSAGKTGTAQAATVSQTSRYNASTIEEHKRDHSLYVAFAPVDHPQIAVAVIVENAGFGATHAAPIVRRVLDYWIAGEYPSEEDMAAMKLGKASAPIGQPRKVSDIALPQDALPASANPIAGSTEVPQEAAPNEAGGESGDAPAPASAAPVASATPAPSTPAPSTRQVPRTPSPAGAAAQ